MALPGTPGQRISDLCNGNKIKQKELAEKIGVSASQLSRIVSGETRTVSSDILIGVAKEFKVSTDYILVYPISASAKAMIYPSWACPREQSKGL